MLLDCFAAIACSAQIRTCSSIGINFGGDVVYLECLSKLKCVRKYRCAICEPLKSIFSIWKLNIIWIEIANVAMLRVTYCFDCIWLFSFLFSVHFDKWSSVRTSVSCAWDSFCVAHMHTNWTFWWLCNTTCCYQRERNSSHNHVLQLEELTKPTCTPAKHNAFHCKLFSVSLSSFSPGARPIRLYVWQIMVATVLAAKSLRIAVNWTIKCK